jgi:PPM family protein phosphatase
MLKVHGVTDQGRVRSNNEDCFTCAEDAQFCAVADGMGGHNAGEVAARIAVETIVACLRECHGPTDTWPFGLDPALSEAGNRLRTAIYLANARILEASVRSSEYSGMGTTVVAAIVEGDRLTVGHVGDSRLYLLRDGHLRPLTRDDSWATAVMASDPTVDPAVVRHHPLRHALTNVVGTRQRIEVHVTEESLADQDVLLLTTDGVHGTLDDERIEALMGQSVDERELAGALVAAALAHGSRDNCTALVARHTSEK